LAEDIVIEHLTFLNVNLNLVWTLVVCDNNNNKLEQIYNAQTTATIRILFVFSRIIAPIILIWPNSNFPPFGTALVILQCQSTY